MIPSSYPDDAQMAQMTARMLLDIKAVHFNAQEPFTHTSGKQAPTYIDCRKPIGFPRARDHDGLSDLQGDARRRA